MFSLGNDDDDMDFMPSGQGLKNLFGSATLSNNNTEQSSSSLKFSAPKQPKSPQRQETSSPGVLFVTVANTYLYQNNNYEAKGKLGVAVTSSKSIMIYGQGKRLLSNCKIAPDTTFSVTANKFVTYYDDSRQYWGVMFTTDSELEQFLQQASLIKYSLRRCVLKQQLSHCTSTKKTLKTDTMNVAYTGWLLEDEKIGKQFDSKDSYKINLVTSSVIKGWIEALPDCFETGVYFIIIPSDLAYGAKEISGRIPSHSDLVFKITVLKIMDHVSDTSQSPEITTCNHNVNELTDSSSVESFPSLNNTNNQGHESNAQKNEILTRIARMGAQPILPGAQRPPSSPEIEQESRSRASSTRSIKSKRKQSRSSIPEERPQIPMKPGPLVSHYNPTQYVAAGFPNFAPVAQSYFPQQQQAPPELKEVLAVNKGLDNSVKGLESSLKDVSAKLDVISQQAVLFNSTVANCPSLDTQLIMFNIQRIVSENGNLKIEVKSKNKSIEEKSVKITQLLNKNQELMSLKNEALECTQNSFLVNSNHAAQQLSRLEVENEQFKNELKAYKSSSNDRQFEISAKNDQISSLRSQIESMYTENNKLQNVVFETRNELAALKMSASNTDNQEMVLQNEIAKLKERVQKSLVANLELSQKVDDHQFNEMQISAKFENKIKRLEKDLENSNSSDAAEIIRKQYEYGINELNAANLLLEQDSAMSNDVLQDVRSAKDGLENEVVSLKYENEQLNTSNREKSSTILQQAETETELRSTLAALNRELDDVHQTLSVQLETNENFHEVILQLKQKALSTQISDNGHTDSVLPKVTEKVKLILNNVFRTYRSEIEVNETYEGRAVLEMTMRIIKNATIDMMNEDKSSDEPSSESEEEEEEEEEPNEVVDENEAGPSNENNSTEFEIPESSTDFLHLTVQQPPDTIDETFYSSFSPDYRSRGSLYNDVMGDSEGEPVQEAETMSNEPSLIIPAPVEDVPPQQQQQEVPQQNDPVELDVAVVVNSEEFAAHIEEDDLWRQPPEEPPTSPSPASFEPNVEDTVNVEDITNLSTEVFGAPPESIQTSPSNSRRDRPPPLFSDSEGEDILFLS